MATKQPVILDGATHNVIQSADKIDSTTINTNPSAVNMLVNDATTGLMVQLNTEASTTVTPSGAGTAGNPLKADVKISGSTNILKVDGNNGLLARAYSQASYTIGYTGLGTEASPFTYSVKLSTDASNMLTTDANGVLATLKLSAVSTDTVTLSGSGNVVSPLKAMAKLSAQANNRISAQADGLYVPLQVMEVAPKQMIRPTGDNVIVTPAYNGNYTAESIYLFSRDSGNQIFTLDLSTYSAATIPMFYKVRVILTTQSGSGSVLNFKTGSGYIRAPDGNYRSSANLKFPIDRDAVTVLDIYVTNDTIGPYIDYVIGPLNDVSGVSRAGTIGSYAMMRNKDTATQISVLFGAVVTGSDYRFAGAVVSMNAPVPQGTWECCGGIANAGEATMFRRIT